MIVRFGKWCGNENPRSRLRAGAVPRLGRSALTDVPDSCYRRGGCSVNDSEEKRLWRPRPGSRVGSRVGVVHRVVGARRERRARSRAVGPRPRQVRRHEARRPVVRRPVPRCPRGAQHRRQNEARVRPARLVRQLPPGRALAHVPPQANRPAPLERARHVCRRPSPALGAWRRKWRRKLVRRWSQAWKRSVISEAASSSE